MSINRSYESEQLIEDLKKHRKNDVFVKVIDDHSNEQAFIRVHGVEYDGLSDSIVILAHQYYR